MEYPRVLFPGFYHEGPIVQESSGIAPTLGWGGYDRVQQDVRDPQQRRFVPLYTRAAERWESTEPAPVPRHYPNIVSAETAIIFLPQTTAVIVRMVGRFCWDQSSDAFQTMGRLLEPHIYLGEKKLRGNNRVDKIKMTKMFQWLHNMPFHECPFSYTTYPIRGFSLLTGDWLPDVPPALLAELVNDGMAEDWKQLQFQESVTGGALCWVPYPDGLAGCLIYPRGPAMNQLHFQQMIMMSSRLKNQGKPAVCNLQQRILQISTGEFDNIFVGVRSAYNLATWSFSADDPPRPLGVVRTKTPSTCINVSPHLPGELCVCTESGTLYLWNLERGLQRIRQDEETLFFRDDSPWRWSDFTSHPRVLQYTDRTGVQAADVRVKDAQSLDLFRIGQDSSCQRGERVILSRCLRETNPAHFLVTTQFSVYIMDERCPLVPMAKWAHMLERPPSFVNVVPGDVTNKILLGTQHSQETVLLQYSGGNTNPCQLHLPALKLSRNSESLHYLDPLPPLLHDTVTQRLASPMAGLATAYNPESMMVFLLTEAGDVFTQQLVHKKSLAPSSSREGHFSRRSPTASSEQASEDVAIGSGASGQEPASARAAECSPELDSTDPIRASSPIREVDSTAARSLSAKSKLFFSKWISALLKQGVEVLQRPESSITKLFSAEELRGTPPEVEGLRESLRQAMRAGKLQKFAPPTISETVERVRTEDWTDPLSQRLSAAWEGRLTHWWNDHLGLNKQSKVQALREKIRRQKLQRARSQSSLTGSFLSPFSFGSEMYEAEASSPWSYDGAPMSDMDTSVHSAVSETQGGADPIEQASNWSFQSGPSRRSDLFHGRQAHPQAKSELSSQISSEPKLSEPCAITSSLSLRSKGIPRERRRTLQDFISIFGESRDTQTSDPTPVSQEIAPSQSSERLSRSFQSQTPSQRPQTRALSMHSEIQTGSQPPRGTSSQGFSQRSAAQSRLQRPPAKKFRMGF
ncbi:PREDICTED: TATA box-binding protein-associated factor RNA polymerase I subunit C [Nanorana parkeri]|uniref:TATA box-binding protein-associated factor RNA polymerase I subunit C n=1 Tax=Nanorana parkeri TaxID=125878 RepID=UPI000854B4E0|nr:PREDICTED: TATA box-binding protein-associated factor RNA polymerase I subunit C [Nanorana parkeri]